MIVVRRIAGESYDLVTGQQQQKALVLSNGTSEVLVPVDDDVVLSVIQLMTTVDTGDEPVPPPTFEEDPREPPADVQNQMLRVAPSPDEEDQFEAVTGEYDDPESGTVSI